MGSETKSITLVDSPGAKTRLLQHGQDLWFDILCGVKTDPGGNRGQAPSARGMALIKVDGKRHEASDIRFEPVTVTESEVAGCGGVTMTGKLSKDELALNIKLDGDYRTGLVHRRDTLEAIGEVPVNISRCLSRFVLPSGSYEVYCQASRWCHENQGTWRDLDVGILLEHTWGRTTQGCTPYLGLRRRGDADGVAFHIVPCGNWIIRVRLVADGGNLPRVVVELGLSDEDLNYELLPGQRLELPGILVHPLPGGEVHLGASLLHDYLLRASVGEVKPLPPVVYNTWFDQFDVLDEERLRSQLAGAKSIGCEVFVIDAGWYGPNGDEWWSQAGDWREKTLTAFHGTMTKFADEVRNEGLGFGLWMEPERFCLGVPVYQSHPEWFVESQGAARIDLTRPEAYEYLFGEICRLVDSYRLAWMKIDFNFSLGADIGSGTELHGYYSAWYRMLDELRTKYPSTFFEGCSSGALRSDLACLSHFDALFLSDTVNPVDMVRISQGTWLRLLAGHITRWAVLRISRGVLPRYQMTVEASPPSVFTPQGAVWEPSETVDLMFALLVAMPGVMGFSGDLSALGAMPNGSPEAECAGKIRRAVAFYKEWRRFLRRSVLHYITPPELLSSREGWVAIQLSHSAQLGLARQLGSAGQSDSAAQLSRSAQPGLARQLGSAGQSDSAVDRIVEVEGVHLVFVYKMGNCGDMPRLALSGLDASQQYAVRRGLADDGLPCIICRGDELMNQGLPMEHLWTSGSTVADVYIVQEVSEIDLA